MRSCVSVVCRLWQHGGHIPWRGGERWPGTRELWRCTGADCSQLGLDVGFRSVVCSWCAEGLMAWALPLIQSMLQQCKTSGSRTCYCCSPRSAIFMVSHLYGQPASFMASRLYGQPSLWSAIFMASHLYGQPSLWPAIFMVSHLYGQPSLWSAIFLYGWE